MDRSTTLQSYGSRAQGWFFLMLGSISLGFLFAAIVSRFIPASENRVGTSLRSDRYYCFLVPLTLPIVVVAILLFSGAFDSSYRRCRGIFSLAEHEILQACMSSQDKLLFFTSYNLPSLHLRSETILRLWI
ncbi:hypothetical protein U1Q18_012939 [Sarracenia purpurea var. burkii]